MLKGCNRIFRKCCAPLWAFGRPVEKNRLAFLIRSGVCRPLYKMDPTMPRYTLQLDDFEICMFLGLHEFEKQTPQRVLISATIETNIESYENGGYFDYDALAGFLRDFNGEHVETQEELVRRIHGWIMTSPKVVQAVVHTRKPDIYPDAAGVGLIYGQCDHDAGRRPYVIQLDEVEIMMRLGVHPYEKETPQRVLVSATIVTDVKSYDDGGFYDYDILVDYIRSLSGSSVETQEELLDNIHAFITEADIVTDALVHTRKPDVLDDACSIGIVKGHLPFPYQQTFSIQEGLKVSRAA
jgi:7,8-dihydroneopterin aldolase/epimerase/oxygenase